MSNVQMNKLKDIIDDVEEVVGCRRETLGLEAANLARTVGPLAAAHELASLALEYYGLSASQDDPMDGAAQS